MKSKIVTGTTTLTTTSFVLEMKKVKSCNRTTATAKHTMGNKNTATKDTPVFAAAGPGSQHKTAGRGRDLGPAAASAYTSTARGCENILNSFSSVQTEIKLSVSIHKSSF